MIVYLGDRRIEVEHPGHPAHTTGDLVVWLPDVRVLFAGAGGTPKRERINGGPGRSARGPPVRRHDGMFTFPCAERDVHIDDVGVPAVGAHLAAVRATLSVMTAISTSWI